LASNAKFNTLRSGGLLNQWAIAGSIFGKQSAASIRNSFFISFTDKTGSWKYAAG
jgi:hypothetical protein